jgi:hypothetical protein
MRKEKVPFCDLGADYYSVINLGKNNKEKSPFIRKIRGRCNYSAKIASL